MAGSTGAAALPKQGGNPAEMPTGMPTHTPMNTEQLRSAMLNGSLPFGVRSPYQARPMGAYAAPRDPAIFSPAIAYTGPKKNANAEQEQLLSEYEKRIKALEQQKPYDPKEAAGGTYY